MTAHARQLITAFTLAISTASLSVQALAQAPQGGQGGGGRGSQPGPLLLTTTAFEDGGVIPAKYTSATDNPVSPELKWSQVPPGTQSFVLLMRDPEPVINKGAKEDIVHWVVWNIPATSTGLPENVPQGQLQDGSRQVSRRSNGYLPPGAPAPGPYHHYTWILYAIDVKTIDVPQGTPEQSTETRAAVINAMDGHVLGKALLMGRFHR